MVWTDKMVTENDLSNIRTQRSKPYIYQAIDPALREYHENLGWEVDKELKKKIRMRKSKPHDETFEDRVWMLFAKMGFSHMNRDRKLAIPYDKNNSNLTQQVDVLAIDEDTAIIVECKCAQSVDKKHNFKEEITALQGNRQGVITAIRKKYPKRKFAYIFATQNYVLGDQDMQRLKEADITYFDEDVLHYFESLVKQLGRCAKYQLQGHLFMNKKIDNMQSIVPAVRGDMGGHTYYAFSIRPSILLKMCHVLHRDKINKNNMPAYQRFIKRDRLTAIRKFVNDGGYFPNSIVINIDVAKKLQFDLANLQCEESLTKLGLLHLPSQYHSAYVIDGQHRLYGYSETEYVDSNTIPVVAFVGLQPEEQVELFMQINENQKAVPKELRNVLNASMLLDSEDLNSRRKALRLSIAQNLGEDRASPLFGRIIISENNDNPDASVTMEAISEGLKKGGYLNTYKKKGSEYTLVEQGLFDKIDVQATRDILYPFLKEAFNYIQECLNEEWDKGKSGILVINNSIQAIIMLLYDIILLLKNKGIINPISDKASTIMEHAKFYIDPMIAFIQTATEQQRNAIKRTYGTNGPINAWRTYQKAVADAREDFSPAGLAEWWRDNAKQFNDRSGALIRDISKYIKDDIEKRLNKKYGNSWFTQGVPKTVYMAASKMATTKNYGVTDDSQRVTEWNCVNIAQCRQIVAYGGNWQEIFSEKYAFPNTKGKRDEKTEWMMRFDKIRSKDLMTYSISEEEYKFLQTIYDWLCK